MKLRLLILAGFILLSVLSGCSQAETLAPTSTALSTSTSAPSATPTLTPTITPVPFTPTPALPGRIEGLVLNSSAEPLVGVGIKLLRDHDLVTELKTDADGKFTIENVPPGKYVIGYDYFPPNSSLPLHYFSEEFVVESEATTQLEYIIAN